MIRLLIDQNLNRRIIEGVQLRMPDLDAIFALDVGLAGATDPDVLEWAAANDRVVVTHDAKTMPNFAYDRLAAGRRVPGLIAIRTSLPIGAAIDDLLLILNCCREDELDGQVYDVPI